MADTSGHALVVWNGRKFRRITGKVFTPEKDKTKLSIAGEEFQLGDGIQGIALSPRSLDYNRYLVFRPFASYSMYMVNTKDLLYRPIDQILYNKAKDILQGHASAMSIAFDNTLLYGAVEQTGINCFDMKSDFNDSKKHVSYI